jgi:hypothetical protein
MTETVMSELETSTKLRFMPLVTNQIYVGSPILERVFKTSQEGEFGLALPKPLVNWVSKIYFDSGKAVIADPRQV